MKRIIFILLYIITTTTMFPFSTNAQSYVDDVSPRITVDYSKMGKTSSKNTFLQYQNENVEIKFIIQERYLGKIEFNSNKDNRELRISKTDIERNSKGKKIYITKFEEKIRLKEGNNYINILAIDKSGNKTTKRFIIQFIIDNDDPVLTLTKIEEYNSREIFLTGTIYEKSKIDRFTINGKTVRYKISRKGEYTFSHIASVTSYQTDLSIEVRDERGNKLTLVQPLRRKKNVEKLNWLTSKKDITTESSFFDVSFIHVTDEKSDKSRPLKIFNNNTVVDLGRGGARLGEGEIYEVKIPLTIGENNLWGEIDGVKSSVRTIVRKQKKPNIKPNLYLIAIGPDYKDNSNIRPLEYCDDDAMGFYDLFKEKEREVFGKVSPYLLIGNKATSINIDLKLGDLKDYKIKKEDFVIVFIAAHGYTENNRDGFIMKASDYNPRSVDFTTYSYKKIAKHLSAIKCKKLIFLDACMSGAVDGARGDFIDIFEPIDMSITITSSAAHELSYEHENLKHGVFTFSLINGLKGMADENRDKKITIDELYNYVGKEVPTLVKKIYGNKVEQNPQIIKNGIKGDIQIFSY